MKKRAYKIGEEYYFLVTPKRSAPFFISEVECDDFLKYEIRYNQPTQFELLEEFPEAKKQFKNIVKEINEEIEDWQDRKRKNIGFAHEFHIEDLVKKRNRYTIPKGDGQDLNKAKQMPITDFIEFKHGFAKCIWHSERTPSMFYYPKDNRVHCFSCQKNGDVIDVVQALHGLTLSEAVKKILGQ